MLLRQSPEDEELARTVNTLSRHAGLAHVLAVKDSLQESERYTREGKMHSAPQTHFGTFTGSKHFTKSISEP
eukprot:2966109-Heterocapsa_arctica.AAC.1